MKSGLRSPEGWGSNSCRMSPESDGAWRTLNGCGQVLLRRPVSSRRSGQALVVGVTIMFILLAVGLLFLRNALNHLQTTSVSNERIADVNYARSGIDFADHELMTSPIGADWRMQPRNLNPGALAGLPADPPPAALDPDYDYLRPWAPVNSVPVQVLTYKGQPIMRSLTGPTGGYTRINFGQGRALVRVTYNPRNATMFNGQPVNLPLSTDLPPLSNPNTKTHVRGPWTEYGPTQLSQYVRIDTIGRFGNTAPIDNAPAGTQYSDTTQIVNAGIDRPYRVQMVAFKSFGLGDHLLFVTNKEKEGGIFTIGHDPVGTNANTATFVNETPGAVALPGDLLPQEELGGGIQVNGDVEWDNVFGTIATGPAPVGAGVFIAGPTQGNLTVNGTLAATTSSGTDPLFANDLVRDNQWFNTPTVSSNRSVKRLQSPSIDLDRFRDLTQKDPNNGLWINNSQDMQPVIGLTDVHTPQQLDIAPQSWMNPYNPPKSEADAHYWKNPYFIYVPPATRMVFNVPDAAHTWAGIKYYYIRLYSSGDTGVPTLDVYYTPDAIVNAGTIGQAGNVPFFVLKNHTIMAEGNLSVQGDIAPGMTSTWWTDTPDNVNFPERESAQLAVVSRGTIYIEGSLDRAEDGSGTKDDIQNYGLKTLMVPSAVALLAQDHIAVNTTRSGTRVEKWDWSQPSTNQPDVDIPAHDSDYAQNSSGTSNSSAGALPPAFHYTFDPNRSVNDRFFRITFYLPPNPNAKTVRLYLRHAAKTLDDPNPVLDTDVEAYLNPLDGAANWTPYLISKNGAGQSITPVVQAPFGEGPWEYSSYDLPIGNGNGQAHLGQQNSIDVTVNGDTYYLSRVAVLELDNGNIRLPESTLNLDGAFLASEGSFYVIPKDFFYIQDDNVRRGDGVIPAGMPFGFSAAPGANYPYWPVDSTYPADGYPQTGVDNAPTPLLQSVALNGSLTVNVMPTGSGQRHWTQYDPAPATLLNSAGNTAASTGAAAGPLFTYNDDLVDISLRQGFWLPVMPRLPMTPGLVYEGETTLP